MGSAPSHLKISSPGAAAALHAEGVAEPLSPAVYAISDGAVTWRLVLDKLRQGLCVFDGAQRLVMFNRRYAELCGVSPADLRLGMTLSDIVEACQGAAAAPAAIEDCAAWHAKLEGSRGAQDRIVHLPGGKVLEIHVARRSDGGWVATQDDITERFRGESALREKAALLQLAQEAAGAGLFDWDLIEGTAYLSPESLGLFDLPADRQAPLAPAEWNRILHPDDLPILLRESERAVATLTIFRVEFRIPRAGRPDRWLLAIGRVVTDPGGQPVRIVGLNIDLTERKLAEEASRANEAALRSSEERLAFALDAGSDGLWDWNVATGNVWFSDRWQTMLGYAPGGLEGRIGTWEDLIHPEDRDRATFLLTAHFEQRSAAYECEHRLRRQDGGWGWVLARGKVVARASTGAPLRIVGTHIDISARKAAEAQVAYLASHDALTDLPNRRLFHDRLDQRLAELRRCGRPCAVFCLDIDRFKAVNDMYGHLAGDVLLRNIAQRIRQTVRREDMVARLGGDEFAILVDTPAQPAEVAALAERLVAAVGAPVTLGAQQAAVGLSIGIALAPEDGLDGDGLLSRADVALYRAKAEGRNTHRFFEPAMDDIAAQRRSLEQDLRFALNRREFVLHYQPQVHCPTGAVVGFEALVRWQHPIRGLVYPADFIPSAEETGLIVDLGEWVLREACRVAAGWAAPLKIAVNVSPRQFQHTDLAGTVAAVLAETGLAPARLELEITEGVIINDMARALDVVARLKTLGVRIAMDDFGTGYSSLATLQAVPFDTIKIDRSFVVSVETSAPAASIVRAVVELGRSLGMGVLAEGVETKGQRRFLAGAGCTEMQGYLFGRPLPAEQLAASPAGEV